MGIEIVSPEHIEGSNLLSDARGALHNSLKEPQQTNTLFCFLLSGGSSLVLLEEPDSTVIGANVTIAPLDERYSTNPTENNMAQITSTTFYSEAVQNGAHMIDTRVREGESREELTGRFNDSLLSWIQANPNGRIIATTGIGPDGHVSGIMPYPEDSEGFRARFDDGDTTHLVVGYDAGDKNQYSERVTTTMNLLRKIDTAIAYVTGSGKKEAVRRVLSDEGSIPATPARILREIPGKVLLFTDQV